MFENERNAFGFNVTLGNSEGSHIVRIVSNTSD
jgi:hypothetical protein